MALLSDWVVETASAPGVGNVTLAGHLAGPFIRFQDAFGASATVFYTISDETSQRETGIGTLSTSTTLARTTVLHNTAGTQPTKLNFTTAVTVWCAVPAANALFLDASNNLTLPNLTVSTALTVAGVTVPQILFGHLGGLGLSNDGTSPNTVLDIAAGTCTDSTNSNIISLSAITKSISGSWVAGSGNNGMGTGLTFTASTWYHVFVAVISGASDVFFDTSTSAANAPAGTTAFRRIGSILASVGATISAFTQNSDEFLWTNLAGNNVTPVVAGTPLAITVRTPLGVRTNALIIGNAFNVPSGSGTNTAGSFLVQSRDTTFASVNSPSGNAIVSFPASSVGGGGTPGTNFSVNIRTDTASLVEVNCIGGNVTCNLVTVGYIDTRGRA